LNHLAHAFLSFGNEDLLVGNFIGDFVKGKDWQRYPAGVQQGILLHRSIDSFTDNHPATELSKSRIRAVAKRYASPVADVLYDHLLAINWARYTDQPFFNFAQSVYDGLEQHIDILPDILQRRLPLMVAGKFLDAYATKEGMQFVMGRFSNRLAFEMDTAALMELFFHEIDAFSADFNAFFPDLIEKVQDFIIARPLSDFLSPVDPS
jgi:acyl carrier protein phosphodiesterase